MIGGKAKSEYIAPKLMEYTCDILLDADHGVNPRKMLNSVEADDGKRRSPLFHHPVLPHCQKTGSPLPSMSDSWDAVIKHGLLVQCKVNLTIKEYVG